MSKIDKSIAKISDRLSVLEKDIVNLRTHVETTETELLSVVQDIHAALQELQSNTSAAPKQRKAYTPRTLNDTQKAAIRHIMEEAVQSPLREIEGATVVDRDNIYAQMDKEQIPRRAGMKTAAREGLIRYQKDPCSGVERYTPVVRIDGNVKRVIVIVNGGN